MIRSGFRACRDKTSNRKCNKFSCSKLRDIVQRKFSQIQISQSNNIISSIKHYISDYHVLFQLGNSPNSKQATKFYPLVDM